MRIDREKLENLTKPLIEYLNNLHPHVKIIIDATSAELYEGQISIHTEEYIKD